jgi:hypothetical protein
LGAAGAAGAAGSAGAIGRSSGAGDVQMQIPLNHSQHEIDSIDSQTPRHLFELTADQLRGGGCRVLV